jgi:hypothetical protein
MVIALVVSVPILGFGFPGEGVHIGDAVLSPFAEFSAEHDSNVLLSPTNKETDVFTELEAGLQLHYEPGYFTLDGRAFALSRRYTRYGSMGFENAGEQMTFMTGSRDVASVSISESYRQINDYDRSTYYGDTLNPESQNLSLAYDESIRVRRTLEDVGVNLGRQLTDKTDVSLGFNYGAQNYDSNRLFNVESLVAQGGISYRVTDKSSIMLAGQYGMEDNASFAKDSTFVAIQGGVDTKSTDKMTLKASAGVERYSRDATVSYNQSVSDFQGSIYTGPRQSDEQVLTLNLAATWIATDKITLEASGLTGIESAQQYVNTLNQIAVATANAVYQVSDSITMALTGSYREDKYLDPVIEDNIQYNRVDNRIAGLIRADYRQPTEFLSIFIEAGLEKATSTVPDFNYDQLRIGLGISARY